MSEMDRILQRKANELVTRKIDTPRKEEQHLVLHWKNDQGFGIEFNLTMSLRTSPVKAIFSILEECQKEFRRRGIPSSAR